MRILPITLLLFASANCFSETINIEGKEYPVIENTKNLQCANFSVTSVTRELSHRLHYSEIPENISMGHQGGNYLSQSMTFKAGNLQRNMPALELILTGYNKISADRPYLSTPVKCVGSDTLLVSMWSGGNCSTVCEAYALITFDNSGNIIKSKGLTYKEYKQYRSN